MLGCGKPSPEQVAANAKQGPRQIVALGRLEPAGGVLQIGAIPGDVLKGFPQGVVQGAVVKAGSELARLKSYDLRNTQLDAVNAKLAVGRQQRDQELAVANANYEQAIAAKTEADAKLEQLAAQQQALESVSEAARIAEADYQSLVKLQSTDPQLVTEIQLRRKRNLAERAVQEYKVQQASHDAASKAAKAAVAAATANVHLAEVNLDMTKKVDRNQVIELEKKVAEETLQQSVLRAPQATEGTSGNFTVLKIFVKPGEFITQLPVMQIGDVSRMICIAEVYEADVKEIAVDQDVIIQSPALSEAYADASAAGAGGRGLPGKVRKIGSLVSNAGLMQRNPLAPSDRSIVEVEIEIAGDDADSTAKAIAEAAKHIGMQVTVTFLNEKAKSAAASK